jgi:isoleucyl-tRNA synthetase
VAALPSAEVQTALARGGVEVEGEALSADDLLVSQEAATEGAVASSGALTVELDLRVTPALRQEGLVRELISKVQGERKDRGLEVEDRIVLSLETASEELAAAVAAWQDLVCAETLAVRLGPVEGPVNTHDCDGLLVQVGLQRA